MVDGVTVRTESLVLAGEDVLMRILIGEFAGGTSHTVTVTHTGSAGTYFYFDFLEACVPTDVLPVFTPDRQMTLATDWDTDDSIALAPERTAWLIYSLGFRGRANHYAGALWFYELLRPGQEYATSTVTFSGNPEFGKTTDLQIGPTTIYHKHLIGDTAESVTKAFELLINAGATGVWARSEGTTLTIQRSRYGNGGK